MRITAEQFKQQMEKIQENECVAFFTDSYLDNNIEYLVEYDNFAKCLIYSSLRQTDNDKSVMVYRKKENDFIWEFENDLKDKNIKIFTISLYGEIQ